MLNHCSFTKWLIKVFSQGIYSHRLRRGVQSRGMLNLKPLALPVACIFDTLLKYFGIKLVSDKRYKIQKQKPNEG